jgi:DnaJ-class molecular chaperone
VSRNATQAEIQKAYYQLVQKYHPDRNKENAASAKKKFQEVQAAFDVLSDPKKREMYDKYGTIFEGTGPGARPRGSPFTAHPGGATFTDVDLESLFSGGGFREGPGGSFADWFAGFQGGGGRTPKGKSPAAGADIPGEVAVPFKTAVLGGAQDFEVRRSIGRSERISVKIPPGMEDGRELRLRGLGEPGHHGGPAGDLLLRVRVDPHPCFERRGLNLIVKVPVTLAEAAAGAKIDVPTPQGTLVLHVPPGTSGGKRLRVRGRGIALPGGSKGDLLAEIQIVLPSAIDAETLEVLRKLDRRYSPHPRASLDW